MFRICQDATVVRTVPTRADHLQSRRLSWWIIRTKKRVSAAVLLGGWCEAVTDEKRRVEGVAPDTVPNANARKWKNILSDVLANPPIGL